MTTSLQHLYEESDFPIYQNRMYETAEAARACPRGQIDLVQDLATGLVRNAAFDPALMVYDAAYQNEQGISASFRTHLEATADRVVTAIGTDLIEVGCGKGTFLAMLRARGAKVTGFDPTFEGDDPAIKKAYFGPETGLNAGGLVLRHVLEHIEDPVEFLRLLARANGSRGLIYIEVPCFDWICDNRAWFDVFYEHVNYFRAADFHKIFASAEVGHCFGGQYLYVIGDLASLRDPWFDEAVPFPDDFLASLEAPAGAYDVVWGGASKGLIYSMLRDRKGKPVRAIVDINPAKQNKYLAGTGLKVSAPQDVLPDLPDTARILVMNPNYTEEIRTMSGNRFTCIEVGR